MQPLVSILIPCHNAEAWIAETLESALNQDWPAKEIIVVDDGSTDRSLEIALDYVGRGILVLTQANRGAATARNVAFCASKGEWLQYLDADDLLAPDKISQQMKLTAEVGPEMLISARWGRFSKSIRDTSFVEQPLCADLEPAEFVIRKMSMNRMMHPGAWLMSRELAQKTGPWDERLSLDDDGEYFTRAVLESRGVRYCGSAVSYYRSNVQGSLSGARSVSAFESALLAARLSAAKLLANSDTEESRLACGKMFRTLMHSSFIYCRQVATEAEKEARRYGVADGAPGGGRAFRLLCRLIGWKQTLRLASFVRQTRGMKISTRTTAGD